MKTAAAKAAEEVKRLRSERDTLYWLCEAVANGDKVEAAKIRAELEKIDRRHVDEFNAKLAKKEAGR